MWLLVHAWFEIIQVSNGAPSLCQAQSSESANVWKIVYTHEIASYWVNMYPMIHDHDSCESHEHENRMQSDVI